MKPETYYLNLMYGRGKVLQNINDYLLYNDGSGYFKLFNLCRNREILKQRLNLDFIFRNSFEVSGITGINFDRLPLEKIVFLSTILFVQEKEKIEGFLVLKKEFEETTITKNYSRANDILQQIYDKYGMSLWLLDACSVLKSLCNSTPDLKSSFTERDIQYSNILDIKNNLKERQDYYINRISSILVDLNSSQKYLIFLKYLLFIELPTDKATWKELISYFWQFSIIDVYLIVFDLLQKIPPQECGNSLWKHCLDNIYLIKNSQNNTLKVLHSNEIEICCNDNIYNVVQAFDCCDFEKAIKIFSQNDFGFYDSFGCYKIVALSYLLSNLEPEKSQGVLYAKILELVYWILRNEGENTLKAIQDLSALSRVLRSFVIHKGICVFLDLIMNSKIGYKNHEQFNTLSDIYISNYEVENENLVLVPYICKYNTVSEEKKVSYLNIAHNYISKFSDAKFYFKQAELEFTIDKLILQNKIEEATSLVVKAYTENTLLFSSLDIKKINEIIIKKHAEREILSLGEVCYTFLDTSLLEIQRDCFLNLFDYSGFAKPLELAEASDESNEIIYFFLDEVCNSSTLPNLYRVFKSTDDVDKYRCKICEFLVSREDYPFKKRALDEIEEITKQRALSKKLVRVEKSRLTIDTDSFKNNCFDEINQEVDKYNNSNAINYKFETLSNGTLVLSVYNFHNLCLKTIFDVYCKEFCFGDYGLDISLSTRVRHGALSNQILKNFADNYLVCNGHGSNEYLDNLIKDKTISPSISKEMLNFSSNIQSLLDYFTQHTLKVVYDVPIEGAIFDFQFTEKELEELYYIFDDINTISVDEVALIINDFLIKKTNIYLQKIREEKLPALQTKLIDELTKLSTNIKKHVLLPDIYKDIEKLIVDCKTGLQNEFITIEQWFSLSEYNQWEDYNFSELLEMCKQINKSLFFNFDKIDCKEINLLKSSLFKGESFRYFIDVVLIIFNNAVVHSGYRDELENLSIGCSISEDSHNLYISFENNIHNNVDLEKLDSTIKDINDNFENKKYLTVNTRQEGGMGLLKIMHTVFSVLKYGESFYVSRTDQCFRVEIKLNKEVLCNEKNIDCR